MPATLAILFNRLRHHLKECLRPTILRAELRADAVHGALPDEDRSTTEKWHLALRPESRAPG